VLGLAASAAILLVAYASGTGLAIAAIGLAPIAVIVSLRNPFLLCLAFILFSFFRIHEAIPVLNPLHIPLALAVGSIGTLAALTLFRRIEIAWTPELRLFLVFFALVTLEIPFATGRDVAIAYWKDSYSKIAIMVFAIASLARTPRDFQRAITAFVLSGVLIASVAIHNRLSGIGLVEGNRVTIGRDIESAIGDPNDLSLVLSFPLSFAFCLVIAPGMALWRRALGAVAFVEVVWAILCTGSRGGMLAIFAVLGAFVAQRIRSKLVLAALGGGGFAFLSAVAGMRGGGSSASGGVDESAHGRIEAWKAAFRMACAHPLGGVGINNFKYNFWFYTDYWEGFAKAVHSTWFCALAESGFVGFGIFLALVARIFVLSNRSTRLLSRAATGKDYVPAYYAMAQAVFLGMAGFCTAGTFLTQAFTWPLYILLALAVATSRAAANLYVSRESWR
jgi:probable O-glycosylation ligase (exosortase A-associated)